MNVALFILVVVVSFVVVRIFGTMHVSDRITILLRRTLLRRHLLDTLTLEEPVLSAPQCAIIKIIIGERSHLVGQDPSKITAEEIEVLASESGGKITTNPAGDVKLNLGDNLLCFGEATKIRGALLRTK